MNTKICERGKRCSHFIIERLIKELGGLGSENGLRKIKSKEEFRDFKRKIEKLGHLVQKFQKEVEDYFVAKTCYLCAEVMEIAWGRRKYQATFAVLKKQKELIRKKVAGQTKKHQEMEVKK